jgi:hypothetical protein
MSLNLVPYPVGIDYPISSIQRFLYERLYVMWGASGMTGDMLESYGRVYRNKSDDGFLPQWYKAGKDYKQDMFYNDKIQAMFWFGLNDPMDVDGERTNYRLSIYFFVNLSKVRPTTGQRVDEQVLRDVLQLLQGDPYNFITTQVYREADNVVSKYSGSVKEQAVNSHNMQPRLCFRIDGECAIGMDDFGTCTPSVMPQNFNTMTGAIRVQIKTTPDPAVMQTLVNGTQIPLEYAAGSTVVIPHLANRYVFPNVIYNNNNINGMPYNPSTQTFTFADGSLFYDGDDMLIYYNENS